MKHRIILLVSGVLFTHNASINAIVHHIKSEAEFYTLLTQVEKAVVKFSAVWCPPCQAIKKPFEQLSDQPSFKDISFIAIDVDEFPGITNKYRISSMPTFVYIHDEQVVGTQVGAPDDLAGSIRANLATHQSMPLAVTPAEKEQGIKETFKHIAYTISDTLQQWWHWIYRKVFFRG
jgi:thioredoxin 1